ncbi:MAG TPA: glycosyltransferase family 4 protein [Pyrinomonadaceae bacterium]|nr:glycosyltransferase family 4 protein [Pyrinomonadaceae bacterium]
METKQSVKKINTQKLISTVKANRVDEETIRVLRIAHASLTPALRGRERGIARVFPQVEMEVVAPEHWRETDVDVEIEPDEFLAVRPSKTFLSKHIQLFAYDPRPIIEVLRQHKPHIIDMDHEPYSVPCAEIITLRNLFAPQTPIVMQTAQNILKKYPPPFSFLEKRALKQVSAAYMCSETVREVLVTKGFNKPMQIAPFGVDLQLFQPKTDYELSNKTFTIGYVGRLLPAKGLLDLADALTKIKSEKWRLLVVGDGPAREPMQSKLAEHGLLERCEFVGAVPYEKTPEYFRKLDVLVIPTQTTKTIREQFGRVIIEAMACRVPVIGSTCGAIPEVIGDAGLVFPERDSEILAQKLRQIIRDDKLRNDLAYAGRRLVEEKYTWERVAERIFDLYRQVLKRPNL